jgi:sugar phosphate isomerase/epimerase
MVTRRNFLKQAGIAAASVTIMPPMDFKAADKKTGLALYTVRNEMAKDIDGTLKAVGEIGYNWVEAANYNNGLFYNLKPAEFKKKCEDSGLTFLSSHSGVNPSNVDKAVADAAEGGIKYLVLPSLPGDWGKSIEGYKKAADFFNIAGEKCNKAGIKFGFHNHSKEFVKIDDQVPFDILVKNTDSKKVFFEIDLCWIVAAGMDPVEYFNNYPGRFEVWHMKDMSAEKRDATMGEGTIDFKTIFGKIKKSGMKFFFVEQDTCRTHTPLESSKISRLYLINNL